MPIPVTAINHVSIRASDPARSQKWFQGLFGLPIVAHQGETAILRIDEGPQYMQILAQAGTHTGYTHFGFVVEDFNAEQFADILREAGLTQSDFPHLNQFTIRNRDSEDDGATEGTVELFLGDPDGNIVQVQDTKYCGGSGLLGEISYETPEPAPGQGLLTIREINHCTLGVSNGKRSVEFYQKIFNLPIDTYQGPTPILRVGSGNASLVLFDISDLEGADPCIDHACFAVDDFDVERVEKVLGDYGLEVLGEAFRATGPMQTYYTNRMPDRGGDPDGTKELYFTDHDQTVVQLSDIRYAGGCGCLGEIRGTGVKHPF